MEKFHFKMPLLALSTFLIGTLLIGIGATPKLAQAASKDLVFPTSGFVQQEFRDLSETIGIIISYTPLAPASPLGILGFDIGLEVTVADIDENASFITETISSPPSQLPLPKLHIQKGLPFGLDLGLVYSKIPKSNMSMIGGELKWAFLKGSVATPAVALRGTYTKLLGVGELDLDTYGLDISASKGFAFLTPYIGVGQIWIKSSPNVPLLSLSDESLSVTKAFAGLKVKMLLLSLVGEVQTAEFLSYSLRANLSF